MRLRAIWLSFQDSERNHLAQFLDALNDDRLGQVITGLFSSDPGASSQEDQVRNYTGPTLTYAIERGLADLAPRILAGDSLHLFRTQIGQWLEGLREHRGLQVRVGDDAPEFTASHDALQPVASWLQAQFPALSAHWRQAMLALDRRRQYDSLRGLLPLAALRRDDLALFLRLCRKQPPAHHRFLVQELGRYYARHPHELDAFAVDRLSLLPLESLQVLRRSLPMSLSRRLYADFCERYQAMDVLAFLKADPDPVGNDEDEEDGDGDGVRTPVGTASGRKWVCVYLSAALSLSLSVCALIV